MDFTIVKSKAVELFSEARFITQIDNESEYDNALELMEELIEDYEKYAPLIEVLSHSIDVWENTSDEFTEFNNRINELDSGVAILKTLMDQYQLKADDLKDELGSKSLVSMLLSGTRKLTREHIQALSDKYHLDPSVFFHRT